MPAIQQSRDFSVAGGLASYGGNFMESHRQAGIYTGRIIGATNPLICRIEQVTKLDTAINLKTAKLFRLTVPHSLLPAPTR